jgi:hypothetical protein
MLHLSLNKKRYQLINDWKSLPLNVAMEAAAIDLPETEDVFDWFMHLDKVKQLFKLFSTIEDVEQLRPEELVHYFCNYILPLVADLKAEYPASYQPQGIESFIHKGKKYIMPKTLHIGDQQILQHDTKVKPFIEASNLLKLFAEMRTEGIKVMPYYCAAIVKESESEYYTEALIAERGDQFKDLPMDIVWECFFFTLAHITRLASATLQSMQAEVKRIEALAGTRFGRWLLRRAGFAEHLTG